MFEKAEHQKKSIGEEDEGLHLRIKVSEGANKGSDFDVFAVVNNNTDEERVCRVTLCARATSHNGTLGPQCGLTDPVDIDIEPRAGKRPTDGEGDASPGLGSACIQQLGKRCHFGASSLVNCRYGFLIFVRA